MLIQTRYLGPTDYRGARIKAMAVGSKRTVTVDYDYALSQTQCHAAAAKALLLRMAQDETTEAYGRPDYVLCTTPLTWDDRGAYFAAGAPYPFPITPDWASDHTRPGN